MLAFRYHLNNLLGDQLLNFPEGSINSPANVGDLARAVAASPDTRVVCCELVQPARASIGDLNLRSVVPIAHPILQTLRRYENWARAKDYLIDGATDANGRPVVDAPRFVAEAIEKQAVLYPLANFHLGLLSGGRADVDPTTAAQVGQTLVEETRALLVDFPHISLPIVMLEVAQVGAAPQTPMNLGFDTANVLLAHLTDWQKRFPPDLFATLCAVNAPDLTFFDAVARGFVDRAPLSAEKRATVLKAIDEAAEITQHRLTGAVQVTTPPASRRSGLAGSFVEADPALGWRLRPNGARDIVILGRDLVMDTDAAGCRPVIGQPAMGEKTVAVYGCSTMYGWSIAAEETACSVLQSMLPTWRVENHGVPGYGQNHNIIQLERNSRWDTAEFVTFGWIGDHLRRNVADVSHVKLIQYSIPHDSPVEVYPRAGLSPTGMLEVRAVPAKRPELLTIDVREFETDIYYRELVCFHLFKRAHEIVTENGGHFFVTSLWEVPSEQMQRWLAEAGIP